VGTGVSRLPPRQVCYRIPRMPTDHHAAMSMSIPVERAALRLATLAVRYAMLAARTDDQSSSREEGEQSGSPPAIPGGNGRGRARKTP
jgi:hypothetical protein